MRIVFIGTVEFSSKALKKLINLSANIVGVCTKDQSIFNSDFSDLAPICKKNNIPYNYNNDINSKDSINWIKKLNPDIIFCFGWSSLIKKELLSIPKMGILGYHPALLPQNRGRHPIIWALVLGLKQTGSTFFFMNEGADEGDILSQETIVITYQDDAKTLYSKVINTALKQIENFLVDLQNNTFSTTVQDNTKANTWRKRSKDDGLIQFNMSKKTIYNLVRALTKPYVGAHLKYNYNDVLIWKVEEQKYNNANLKNGQVIEVSNNHILIKVADGAINILEHEFNPLPKEGDIL